MDAARGLPRWALFVVLIGISDRLHSAIVALQPFKEEGIVGSVDTSLYIRPNIVQRWVVVPLKYDHPSVAIRMKNHGQVGAWIWLHSVVDISIAGVGQAKFIFSDKWSLVLPGRVP